MNSSSDEYCLTPDSSEVTAFHLCSDQVSLARLCGLICGNAGEDTGPNRTRGLALISTSQGRFEGVDLKVKSIQPAPDGMKITWQAGSLELESDWSICSRTGIVSRKDSLCNPGQTPVTVHRCLARFSFPPSQYELYRQESRWANENSGAWIPLTTGRLVLDSEWGRSTLGWAPYVCLRELGAQEALAFHLLPVGNWTVRATVNGFQQGLHMIVLELGLSDEDLHLILKPGEKIELPEILIQPLPTGEPHLHSHQLQAYTLEHVLPPPRCRPPIVYNTWFDRFDRLDLPDLRNQLEAARQIGCEAFVVDAGWFGPEADGWSQAVGDWREKTGSAFCGQMSDFAEEVRRAGLGFGLWMEPERFHRSAPVCRQNPDWFIPTPATDHCRIDLEQPGAYAKLQSEICRMIETYQLVWMKIDFNFDFGWDTSGAEMLRYYQNWYRLLDEIRQRYPQTFFEGCSSGGLRLELSSLKHFDGHFLSDTVNPVDMLRITQGALLRLPPGRITRWSVVRTGGDGSVVSRPEVPTHPDWLLGPQQADWSLCQSVDLDFAVLAAFPGIFGLSGDLASLPESAKTRLKAWIEIYKQYREFILGSTARLLEPPQPIHDRDGWAGFHLEHADSPQSLLLVYRLLRSLPQKQFRLSGLDPRLNYQIRTLNPGQEQTIYRTGTELIKDGFHVQLPEVNRAVGMLIQPI